MSTATKIQMIPITGNTNGTVRELSNENGFISLFRSIRKHWLWTDAEKLKWWVDILLEVNHKPNKVLICGRLIECNRGQSVNSLLTWSKRWRTNISAVRRFFKLLESDQMIVTENVSKTTRLTVCKYDSYQSYRHDSETIMKSKRNADETIPTPNNNDNNDNKREGTPARSSSKDFYTAQLVQNDKAALIEKYKALVDYMNGVNDEDIVFESVLAMEQQLSFNQYLKLREKGQKTGVDLRDILKAMENDKKAIRDKKSMYLTINNWANLRLERQEQKK